MQKLEQAFGVSVLGLIIAFIGLKLVSEFWVAGNLFIVIALALGITTIRYLVDDLDATR